jgi:hypothetical protein
MWIGAGQECGEEWDLEEGFVHFKTSTLLAERGEPASIIHSAKNFAQYQAG